jgi:hypothetical protein
MLLESFPRHHRDKIFLTLFLLIVALAFAFLVLPRGSKKEKELDQLVPVAANSGHFVVSIPYVPGKLFEALPIEEPDYAFLSLSDNPENPSTSPTPNP